MNDFPRNLERFVAGNIMEELCEKADMQIELFLKYCRDTWTLVLSHGDILTKEEFHEVLAGLVHNMGEVLHCAVSGLLRLSVYLAGCPWTLYVVWRVFAGNTARSRMRLWTLTGLRRRSVR